MKNIYLPRYQKILLFCVLLLCGHLTFAQSLPNPTNVTPNQVYCTSVSLTLQATCSQGEPVWFDEFDSQIYDLDVNVSSPTFYYVICEEVCSCNASNPVFVTFEHLEPLVATRNQVACSGDQVKLIASCPAGVVEWFKSDTSTPVAPEDLIQTITAPVDYLVRCNNPDEPCISDTKTVSITLGTTPLDAPTAYTPDQTICRGTPVTLSATCPTGVGHFFEDDGLTEINASAVFAESTSTYKVRCEDNFECPSPFESFTITVTVPPLPTGVTSPTVCKGEMVTLTANCSAGESAAWYLENEITPLADTSFIASTNATYKVRCETIADSTCVSDFVSSVLTVTTNITSEPVSTQVCMGDVATFTVGVNSASTYQWQKRQRNGTYANIPLATSATLTIPNTTLANKGFYRCAVTSTCTIYTEEVLLTFKDAIVDNGKMVPADISFLDQFGSATAISDSLGLVSAWSKSNGEGAVYIYKLNKNSKWSGVGELSPSDLSTDDSFGSALAISGDTLFISAPYQDGDMGSVYIFAKQANNTWTQVDKIRHPDIGHGDNFGESIAVDNGTMAISAVGSEAIYIYERNNSTGVWEFKQNITGNSATDFGYAVGVSGKTLVVGAPGEGADGAIYIFERDSLGVWQESLRSAPVISLLSGSRFGSSVAISGSNIIAAGIEPLSVHNKSTIHSYQQNSVGTWALKGIINSPDIATDGQNASVVAIYDNMAIVGYALNQINKGAAVVFELNTAGNWVQKRLLIPADIKTGDNFGAAVAIGKNGAIVGSPFLPLLPIELRSGSAYFYRLHTYPKPVVNTVAQAASVCPAETATFNLTGLPSTDAYTITYKIDVAGTEKSIVVTPDSTGKASFTETLILANNTKSIFITKIKNNVSTCEQPLSVSSVLTVKAPTQIIEHPAPMTVCFGETAYFMSEATGEGLLSFQWQRQAPTLSGFDQVLNNSFSDVSMLTLPDRTLADNGARYRVKVFGECGVATSNDAMLTVLPKASVSATTTGPICPGSTAQINFIGTPNAEIFYTVNNVPASVTLNAMGTATVNTAVLTHDVDYHLTSMHVLGNCNQQLSDIVRVQVRTLGSNPPLVLTSPLHDVLPNGTQSYAAETIQTTNKINTSASATHIGNKFVILEPGFEAKSGSVYTARVTAACP